MIEQITEIFSKQGIHSFGVCRFKEVNARIPSRSAWRLPDRPDSVIVCAFPYYTGQEGPSNLSQYAWIPDYHIVCSRLLDAAAKRLQEIFPGNYAVFCDISPLPEKQCAVLAGLGVLGKNGLLIHPKYGSYLFVGEIVTDVQFPSSRPSDGVCANCGACLDACPSGALSPDGFQKELCLSSITQQKGSLSQKQIELLRTAETVWGCDRCQECCPENRRTRLTHLPEFTRDIVPLVTEENLSGLMKTRAFGYKGRALMERNLGILDERNIAGKLE